MASYRDTHCSCGFYIPASRRKAGKEDCAACEAQTAREVAAADKLLATFDVAEQLYATPTDKDDKR